MKKIIKIISGFAFMGGLYACGNMQAKKSDTNTETVKPTYKVISIKQDTLSYKIELPGTLKPYEQVVLYSKIDGFVSHLKVDRGDYVKKGQLLMEIDAPEIQQKLLAAQAKNQEVLEKYQFSLENYQRMKDAASVVGAVSTTELQRSKTKFMVDSAALESAKAEVKAANQLVKYTKITAPFDGVITDRLVSPGALVGGGQKPLLKLNQEDKLRLIVAIPSEYANDLNDHSKATFSVNSFPGKRFSATLSRSSQALSSDVQSMKIEFDYDNGERKLKGGSYAKVQLQFKRNYPTLLVPSSSIITTQNEKMIAKVVDGKIKLFSITTGMVINNRIEVFGDLETGDQILIKPSSTIKDGTAINAVLSEN